MKTIKLFSFFALVLGGTATSKATPFDIETKITATDAAAGDSFGGSVAISGNTALVGAVGGNDGFGSAYLFDVTTGNQLFKLTAPPDTSGIFPGDMFGSSVAISGNTALVGAVGDGFGGTNLGSAYLFDTTGNQLFKLTATDAVSGDLFGGSVAISGNTALVGAPGNDDGGNSSGSAYLFDTTTGNQLAKLTANDAAENDSFGFSVAINGNTALVGATGDNGSSGSAYLFDITTGNQLFKLTANDAAAFDNFGFSVAISGNTALVGAPGFADNRSAYLFDITTGNQLFKLTDDDGTEFSGFGNSVAISGDTALVGAFGGDDGFGSAYLFEATTGNQLAKLTASDTAAFDDFARSVAISGNTALVGARRDDDAGPSSGSAYLFDSSQTQKVILAWEEESFFEIKQQTNAFGQTFHVHDPSGTMAAFDPTEDFPSLEAEFEQFKTDVLLHVQQQFADSGITNVVVANDVPDPNQGSSEKVVYLVDPDQANVSNTIGGAALGTDRFNAQAFNDAAVFIRGFQSPGPSDVERDAESIVHEVGHLMGLKHVDPPGSLAVMDYDFQAGDVQLFTNGVFNVTEPPGPAGIGQTLSVTQNPLYHLKRYVDGESHGDLVAAGINPGTWDLAEHVFSPIDLVFSFSGADPGATLFDVMVLETNGGGADDMVFTQVASFSEITLDELSNMSFQLDALSGIALLGASTPGGPLDIALALGDPFAENGLTLFPAADQMTGFLQMSSAAPAGFETLADVNLTVTTIPEPSTCTLALASLCLAISRRRIAA